MVYAVRGHPHLRGVPAEGRRMMPEEERGSLTPEQADYYRQMLVTHADAAQTDACQVCRVSRCPDWRYAYDRLAASGEPMVKPRQWYRPETGAVRSPR